MEKNNKNLNDATSATINTAKTSNEENGEITEKQKSGISNLTSPESVSMFCVAAIFDGMGFIILLLTWLGIDDYGVLDIFGVIIFGTWLFITRGFDGFKKIIPKLLITFGIESIPALGSASPSWIIFTYKTLNDS